MSPSRITPHAGETLREFLRRARKDRGYSSQRKFAERLQEEQAQGGRDTWLRQVKRYESPNGTKTITAATAELLGQILGADFKPFIRRYPSPSEAEADFRRMVLNELRKLQTRVRALEEKLPPER